MSPTRSVTLTDELYERASREAQSQGKTTDEFTSDALAAYLAFSRLIACKCTGSSAPPKSVWPRPMSLG